MVFLDGRLSEACQSPHHAVSRIEILGIVVSVDCEVLSIPVDVTHTTQHLIGNLGHGYIHRSFPTSNIPPGESFARHW